MQLLGCGSKINQTSVSFYVIYNFYYQGSFHIREHFLNKMVASILRGLVFFIYISNRIRVKLSQLEGARSERVNKLILTLHSIPLKLNSKSICPIFSSSEKNIFNMKVSHKQKTFHSFLQILKDLCIKCERLSSCCRGSVDQDNSVNPRWMQHPESNKDTFCYKYFPNRCYDST